MVFLKLEKLGVLESGILFIAAVIIMIIILFLLLFLMICRTSRGPCELALAHLSDFGPLGLPPCSLGLSYIVFTLSSDTPLSFPSEELCFCCFLMACIIPFLQSSTQR